MLVGRALQPARHVAMTMRRLALLVVLCLLFVEPALAASVSVSSNSLAGASLTISRCTTAGLAVFPNFSGATVVSVTVSGLPSTCGNGTLQATVNNGTVNASGSAAIPAAGGAVTVTLSSAPALTAIVQTDLVVVGP
jgi:hypothetical protein